ncbi:lysine transporter LysE [Hahella sp. CCB-MM4]|uniref:LysE family translocator n=1 Tax=Hahella sp. (strain CCB-MM4) TaxID=1926491 RepID=UPI000B9BDDF6|nr:LysE family translocator [Hahella sp. CCB-MM4]OZG73546.1 lysine transporter LysE [Hahella sp. CCB-MM4]
MSLEYILTSLVIVLLPGTGVLYTMAYGLSRGWKASAVAAFGCTLGILPHIAASIAGLAALLHTSAVAFQVVKYLGVAYLFYMAWGILRDGGTMEISDSNADNSSRRIIANAILFNILNPKLSLFFLAFLPQFVPVNAASATQYMLELAGVFMLMTFVVFLGYGAFASATRRYVISRPGVMKWFRRGFASAFGALGIKLALSDG